MTARDRHKKVTDLFLAACDQPPERRAEFLVKACGDDSELRLEVEALLAHDRKEQSFGDKNETARIVVQDSLGETPQEIIHDDRFPKIDGYRIEGVLGQGGMGIVYRATQLKLKRMVALKVLPSLIGKANPSAVSRFRREALAAGQLHHTNIVPVYDFGEAQDCYFYAMELVEGKSLDVVIKCLAAQNIQHATTLQLAELLHAIITNASQPSESNVEDEKQAPSGSGMGRGSSFFGRDGAYFRQIASWMSDTAGALQHAHDHSIIHRDIKPANLIGTVDGRIMVADFGLAKSTDERSVTMTGALLGTLRYMSPEQAMAKRVRVDHRTDVYSLGATMYELLCLAPAFPATEEKEILGAIISRDPVAPRRIMRQVPHELETICLKCMEKNPDARYASAHELMEDLRRYLSDIPILAKPPGVVERVWKFCKRRRTAIALTTACLFGLLLIITSWMSHQNVKKRRIERISNLVDGAAASVINEEWSEAEAKLTEALVLAPGNSITVLTFVWMKLEQYKVEPDKATTDSLENLDRKCLNVLAIDPKNYNALNSRSVVLKKLGRLDEAISVAEQAVDVQPTYVAPRTNLGAYYALAGDLSKAGVAMSQALDLINQEEDADTERTVHAVNLTGGETTETAIEGNTSAKVKADAYRNLAALQLYQQDPRAEATLRLAIEQEKKDKDPRSFGLLARMLLELKGHEDIEQASEEANFADNLADEQHPTVKRMRAMAYLRRGKFVEAIKHAELAFQLGDMSTVNHLIIAVAHAKLNDHAAARRRLKNARSVWPEKLQTGDFYASSEGGFLWFESAAELNSLRDEATELLNRSKP